MKTNGLELNVNDLIDQVIQLTEEKMLAAAKLERLEVSVSNYELKLKEYEGCKNIKEPGGGYGR